MNNSVALLTLITLPGPNLVPIGNLCGVFIAVAEKTEVSHVSLFLYLFLSSEITATGQFYG